MALAQLCSGHLLPPDPGSQAIKRSHLNQFHSYIFDTCSKKQARQSKQAAARRVKTQSVSQFEISPPPAPPPSPKGSFLFLFFATIVHNHRNPPPGPARSARRKVSLPLKAVLKVVDMIFGFQVVLWAAERGAVPFGGAQTVFTSDWAAGAETAGCVALWEDGGSDNPESA